MRFGTGRAVITPAVPMKMACTGDFDSVFTDVHDDLFTKALILENGTRRFLLMSFDLLFHARELNDTLAEYAASQYGIDREAVVVNYSHAHTSPASKDYNLETYSPDYEEFLCAQGKLAIDRAALTMRNGMFSYGYAQADQAMSRRLIAEGHARFAPSPDNVRHKEAPVLAVFDQKTKALAAVVVEYGCHPVHYPAKTSISSEYPGRICSLLEGEFYGVHAMFIQGAGGSSRPKRSVGTDGQFRAQCSFQDIDAMAHDIAAAVSQLIRSGTMKKAELSLACGAEMIQLPLEVKEREFFREAEGGYDKLAPRAGQIYNEYDTMPDYVALFCGAVKLCDGLTLFHMGGEPCYEVRELVAGTLGRDLFFVGYTDDSAYVVTDRQLIEGGYEAECYIEYRHKGPFRRGVDHLITSACGKLTEKIRLMEGT